MMPALASSIFARNILKLILERPILRPLCVRHPSCTLNGDPVRANSLSTLDRVVRIAIVEAAAWADIMLIFERFDGPSFASSAHPAYVTSSHGISSA
jgi:hypothetical protein